MFRNIVTKFKAFNLLLNQYEYICIALYLVHKNTKNSLSRNQVTALIIQRHMYIESQFTVSFFGFFSRYILTIQIYQNQTKQNVDSVYNQSLKVIRNREASFNFKCNIQK